jgi:formylglycine-generating enzyme required for sulfatase activity
MTGAPHPARTGPRVTAEHVCGPSWGHAIVPWLWLAMALGAAAPVQANGLTLGNVSFHALDTTAGTVRIRFDITWENSWRTSDAPHNWDAAWVFVKVRSFGGAWQHARLHGDGSHGAGTGTPTTIRTGLLDPDSPFDADANWGVGVFIHRSVDGTGTFTSTGVELQWDYARNGYICEDIAEARVFGTEMVHVPAGDFHVGSGGGETGRFRRGGNPTNLPFLVTTEGAIPIANNNDGLWGIGPMENWTTVGAAGTLPAAFPKGHRAFYCMKHHVSQQAYVNFLNTLTYFQQATRTASPPNSPAGTGALSATNLNRNGIDIRTPAVPPNVPAVFACNLTDDGVFDAPDDGQGIIHNYFSWPDLGAYLDWSGLRPMTELEYEKAARGPLAPVNNAYAWGNAAVVNSTTVINDPGTGMETANPANARIVSQVAAGPRRVGVFAKPGNLARANAGAGYHGVLDLSGSVWDRVINVATGRFYTGVHGDGTLTAIGAHNVAGWPVANNGTIPTGTGLRGGTWGGSLTDSRIADRGAAVLFQTFDSNRGAGHGGRGVRTAP